MSMWATEQGGENGGMDEGEYVPFFFFFHFLLYQCGGDTGKGRGPFSLQGQTTQSVIVPVAGVRVQ